MADPTQNATAQAFLHNLHMMNDALVGIGDLVGMPEAWTDPDTIRRRVKDIRTERDTAQAHAKELEAKLEALKRERHDETLRSGERIQDLTRRCADLEAAVSKATSQVSAQSAELDRVYTDRDTLKQHIVIAEARIKGLEANAARLESACPPVLHLDPARDYNAEIVAARIDALKTLGVNPYDPPVCIHGAAKRRAKTLEHAEKLEADVAAVWELWGAGREREPGKLWGAGREREPGKLHELCQEQERLSSALESKLRVITEKLDDTKVPSRYGRDQDGGAVDITERVDLLITYLDDERRSAAFWESSAQREAEERMSASEVLDELGAPDYAGRSILSTAARIRAIPGLLKP